MADQILYARVKQKKATEAVWLANPLILLDGEVAYVVDPTDPAVVINYKIGVGDKTFAELPYVIHYAIDATYQAVKRFINVNSNQVVTGIFKKGVILKRIAFLNTAATARTLKIGTSSGGSQIGQFIFDDSAKIIDINYLFESTQTIYISGISQVCTFFVEYTPYGEAPIDLPDTGPTAFKYPKGHFGYFYNLYAGHLEENFDTSTGSGISGTPFENCALTGTHDLIDLTGTYVVGINAGGSPQDLTGNTDNQVTLDSSNLPPIDLTLGMDRKAGNNGINILSSINPGPYGSTPPIHLGGSSSPFNIQPRSVKMYSFVAISD